MELFKFASTSGSPFQNGVALNNIQDVLWIERYREPGEFSIKGLLSSGLRELLPLGTFISHVDTKTIMIVEDHQIKDQAEKETTVEISGRSLETILEHRIVGAGLGFNDPVPPAVEYILPAVNIGAQAATLISQHIIAGQVTDPNDEYPYIAVVNQLPDEGEIVARPMKRQSVHKSLMGLLELSDYGIKNVRKDNGVTDFILHKGQNKSGSVSFSWSQGELASAEYLWTSRKDKNVAYVKGRYVEEFVYAAGADKANRRVLLVDGTDLDDYLDTTPTGATLTTIRQKMYTRGLQALRWNNEINVSRADVSDFTQYRYRTDYSLGDIVTLDANYGTLEVRRVVEYTEIEDENGESGHPTFEAVPQV